MTIDQAKVTPSPEQQLQQQLFSQLCESVERTVGTPPYVVEANEGTSLAAYQNQTDSARVAIKN